MTHDRSYLHVVLIHCFFIFIRHLKISVFKLTLVIKFTVLECTVRMQTFWTNKMN